MAEMFTPGPWTWHPCYDPTGKHITSLDVTFPGGHSLSGVAVLASVWSANEANANLIAAAPDGYALAEKLVELEPAVEHLPEPMCGDLLALIDEAKALVAKARGEAE